MANLITELKAHHSIVDIASLHGYAVNEKKSTKKALFMERGEDKILIYQRPSADQYYSTCNNTSDKGDVINFLVNKGVVSDLKEAVSYLRNLDPYAVQQPRNTVITSEREEFIPVPVLPIDKDNYLIKSRGISLATLTKTHFANSVASGATLYGQDKTKSTIFPLLNTNGDLVGQNIRNTKFQHLAENSNKSIGYWFSPKPVGLEGIAVFENPIDAISHYQLHGKAWQYCATIGSPSGNVINSIVALSLDENIPLIIAGDNDKAGQNFNLLFLTHLLSQVNELEYKVNFNSQNGSYLLTVEGRLTSADHSRLKELAEYLNATLDIPSQAQVNITTSYDAKALINLIEKLIAICPEIQNLIFTVRSVGKDFNIDLMQSKVFTKRLKPSV